MNLQEFARELIKSGGVADVVKGLWRAGSGAAVGEAATGLKAARSAMHGLPVSGMDQAAQRASNLRNLQGAARKMKDAQAQQSKVRKGTALVGGSLAAGYMLRGNKEQ